MGKAFGYFGLVCMAVSASTTTATMTMHLSLGDATASLKPPAFATSPTSNSTGGSRHLQATCSSDAVTISVVANPSSFSSISSLDVAAGCYQETGILLLGLPYYTPSGLDLPSTFIGGYADTTGSDSASTITRWSLADFESGLLLCISAELAETIHPADATWFCSSEDNGNEVVSSVCGGACEDSDPGETTCSSETFFITSSAFPEFEGCYEPIAGQESEGQPVYSMTGELVEGEPLVQITNRFTTGTGTEPLVWNVGLAAGSTSLGPCASAPSANIKHPSDELWSCDIDGDSDIGIFPSETANTPGLFDVTCGGAATTCNGASPSEDDNGVPATDSDSESDSEDSDSSDSDSDDGRGSSSTGGGVGLAVGVTLRVLSGFVALVLATGFGSHGAV